MLPFLKKQEASVDVSDDPVERKSDEKEINSLEVAMKELFSARTDKERASAFKAAFELCESYPHEEVNHG